jgi:hypothetical protein
MFDLGEEGTFWQVGPVKIASCMYGNQGMIAGTTM